MRVCCSDVYLESGEGKITSGEDFTEVVGLGGGVFWSWLVRREKEEQS